MQIQGVSGNLTVARRLVKVIFDLSNNLRYLFISIVYNHKITKISKMWSAILGLLIISRDMKSFVQISTINHNKTWKTITGWPKLFFFKNPYIFLKSVQSVQFSEKIRTIRTLKKNKTIFENIIQHCLIHHHLLTPPTLSSPPLSNQWCSL